MKIFLLNFLLPLLVNALIWYMGVQTGKFRAHIRFMDRVFGPWQKRLHSTPVSDEPNEQLRLFLHDHAIYDQVWDDFIAIDNSPLPFKSWRKPKVTMVAEKATER